ncbi:hypothetical protein IV38_GL001738 [Lactobacillus selangorensis]|uniref:DUF218 domain-containing protein n=1 Tax=Lactobacillus selangorensis TaxID=81857 RepID=A0A0R2FJL5_9LACO|nr:YdcF family protein [Lactobacillus selangorensis]KRN27899.1 hypothetical protein IV38_GL001738 [Lactobacillus selangorensis]KRN30630.1 hypothetical protein IV40_GL001817 [Lactobacillus selangorensis]
MGWLLLVVAGYLFWRDPRQIISGYFGALGILLIAAPVITPWLQNRWLIRIILLLGIIALIRTNAQYFKHERWSHRVKFLLTEIVILTAFLILTWGPFFDSGLWNVLNKLGVILVSYSALGIAAYWLSTGLMLLFPPHGPFDVVVILGAALKPNGQPTITLEKRLQKGIVVAQQNNQAYLIVSGGRDPGQKGTEAEAMQAYLLAHQIPQGQIILENQARSTFQNLQFSEKIIQQRQFQRPVVVTSNFHVLRATMMARKQKLSWRGCGADTPLNRLMTAMIRDDAGIVLLKWPAYVIGAVVWGVLVWLLMQ